MRDSFSESIAELPPDFEPMPCAIPCRHRKGTWEQLECLRMRLERGEDLYHIEDNSEIEQSLELRAFATARMKAAKREYTKFRRELKKRLADERRKERRKKLATVLRVKNLAK